MFDLQPGPLSLDTADTDRSTIFREVFASAVINEAFSVDSSLVDFGSLVYLTEAPLPPPGFSKKPVRLCSGAVKGKA